MKFIGMISAVCFLSLATHCFADSIDLGGELQHFSCPAAKQITSEVCVSAGGDLVRVDDDTKKILEETFTKVYNNLNSQNCDAESHEIESTMLFIKERALRGRELQYTVTNRFSLYYEIIFQCRGCPNTAGLFGNDAGRRALAISGPGAEEASEDCTCPQHPAHDRAPTEQEFFEEFNKELAAYKLENGEATIVVGPCDDEEDHEDVLQAVSNGEGGAVTVVSAMLASISFLLLH